MSLRTTDLFGTGWSLDAFEPYVGYGCKEESFERAPLTPVRHMESDDATGLPKSLGLFAVDRKRLRDAFIDPYHF